jgi:hypothetical protein
MKDEFFILLLVHHNNIMMYVWVLGTEDSASGECFRSKEWNLPDGQTIEELLGKIILSENAEKLTVKDHRNLRG